MVLAAVLTLAAIVSPSLNENLLAIFGPPALFNLWILIAISRSEIRDNRRIGSGEGWRAAEDWRKAIRIAKFGERIKPYVITRRKM